MTATIKDLKRPGSNSGIEAHQASWIDRIISGIKSLPGPTWAFYLVLLVVLGFLNNWVLWVAEVLPVGELEPEHTTDALWGVYFIGVLHYLNNAAKDALSKFKPLLSVDEIEYAKLENEFTTLPARLGWIAIALTLALQVMISLLVPEVRTEIQAYPPVTNVYQFLFRSLAVATFFSLVFQAIRQLRLISQFHRGVKEVSLFRLGPSHAFSIFTSKLGIALILITIFGVYQLVFLGVDQAFGLFHITLLVVALAAFILPLMSIRTRLLEEKENVLDEIDSRIERLHQSLVQTDVDDFEAADDIQRALQALRTERGTLGNTSTWPWSTGTIRGFLTTFFVPIFLWVITRFLERFF